MDTRATPESSAQSAVLRKMRNLFPQSRRWLKACTIRALHIGKKKIAKAVLQGNGVIGSLPVPMVADDFILLVKKQFGVECAMCNELLRRPIQRVAICGGAGDFLLGDALVQGADAFITGEMHYHQYFGYEQRLQICVIGHYQSEQFTSEIFRDIILRECPGVRIEMAETCTNPVYYL